MKLLSLQTQRFRLPASSTEKPQPPVKKAPHHWTFVWKRRAATVARWLHVYLSMASFGILLFFAVTGLTLNHIDWFEGQQRTTQVAGSINRDWLGNEGKDVQKLEIVEQLRRTHNIRGALGDFRIDDTQCD